MIRFWMSMYVAKFLVFIVFYVLVVAIIVLSQRRK